MKRKLALLTLFIFSLTLFGDQGLIRLYRLKKMARQIDRENSALLRQNNELVGEIARLKEPDYLEHLIRQEKGYIREGEQLVEIPNSP